MAMPVYTDRTKPQPTGTTAMRDLPPIHPGEQLREEFLAPLGITAYRLAKDIGVPVTRIQAIIAERRGITGDTALRLARYFDTTPEFWLNMQRDYELELATEVLGDRLDAEVKRRAA
jgi:addiction module HigA family antidote